MLTSVTLLSFGHTLYSGSHLQHGCEHFLFELPSTSAFVQVLNSWLLFPIMSLSLDSGRVLWADPSCLKHLVPPHSSLDTSEPSSLHQCPAQPCAASLLQLHDKLLPFCSHVLCVPWCMAWCSSWCSPCLLQDFPGTSSGSSLSKLSWHCGWESHT